MVGHPTQLIIFTSSKNIFTGSRNKTLAQSYSQLNIFTGGKNIFTTGKNI